MEEEDAKDVCHRKGGRLVHHNFPGVAMRTMTKVPERDPWEPAKMKTMKMMVHQSHFHWTKPLVDCFPEVA